MLDTGLCGVGQRSRCLGEAVLVADRGYLSEMGVALNDDYVMVRRFAVRELARKYPDSPDTVPMLRRAARDPHYWSRYYAVDLLPLWRTREEQEGLLEAARDQNIYVHN